MTRDWQEAPAQLGDLCFRVMDTSGMEPSMQAGSIQVGGRPLKKHRGRGREGASSMSCGEWAANLWKHRGHGREGVG